MYENLEENPNESYEKADIILTFLFAFIDFIIILFSFINLNFRNKEPKVLEYNIFSLFTIDILIRLIYIIYYYKDKSFIKEALLSFFSSTQFLLIIWILENLYKITNSKKGGKLLKNYFSNNFMFIAFFFLTFSYDKFYQASKNEIIFFQSLIIIYCIFLLYYRLNSKIIKIVKNITVERKYINSKFIYCLLGAPLPCICFFICYYVLKIIFLFLENGDSAFYSIIILRIVKDSSKYFLFTILEMFLFAIR